MSTLLKLLLVLFGGGWVVASGLRVGETRTILEGGRSSSRALVVVLHGGTWRPEGEVDLARRALDDLDDDARRLGLRLLVPRLPEGLGPDPWLTGEAEALVVALIEDEVQAGRADPRRIALAGHGLGATGAMHVAARHPGIVSAVAAWSGTPSPLWDEEQRVVGLVDDVARRLDDVAVYLWTGRDDRVLDRATLDLFLDRMEARAEQRRRPFVHEVGPGGHGYGEGPKAGLRFLKRHPRRERR